MVSKRFAFRAVVAFGMLSAGLVTAVPAVAQDAAAAAPTGLWGMITGPILTLASAAVGVGITWIAARVHAATGVTIAQKYQDDLHRAADTGIQMALNKAGVVAADQLTGNAKLAAIGEALKWVNSSVPGALKGLGVTPQQVTDVITSKLQKIVTANVTPDLGIAKVG